MPQSQSSTFSISQASGNELANYARSVVNSSLSGQEPTSLKPKLADISCVGVFISLKRGQQLRACLGSLSEETPIPLGEALKRTAENVASGDTRFPGICRNELPFLDVEISILYDLEVIDAPKKTREASVEIGSHGIIISRGKKRGLLLPQVAAENKWDAETFLQRACKKAELSSASWTDRKTTLKTFRGVIFESTAPNAHDLEPALLSESSTRTLVEIVKAGFKREKRDFTVSSELIQPRPALIGALIECEGGANALALRQGVTLIELVKQAAQSLFRDSPDHGALSRIVLLSHPIVLNATDSHERFTSVMFGPILARYNNRISFLLKSGNSIQATLEQVGLTTETWPESGAELTAFQAFEIDATNQQGTFTEPTLSVRETNEQALEDPPKGIRPSAVAGKFYPETAEGIQKELDNFYFRVSSDAALHKCRAILLPHAGWKYCGDIIAETVSRAKIPERIVIISPKHTTNGANWSVSNATHWQLPQGKIPVDTEASIFLSHHVPRLKMEADAHSEEHGIEVLLPFLQWANPRIKITPIVIGDSDREHLSSLAQGLSAWSQELANKGEKPPLFVISSDMNHFEGEDETRRKDEMALEQLEAADADGLYQTCLDHKITMCGMRPAVAVLESLNTESPVSAEVVKYGTSAKVSGDSERVVGYAGAILR